jgi:hypothetical protein
MLKIQRFVDAGVTVLVLSGRIEVSDLAQLEGLVEAERGSLVLDLKEVTVAGREAVTLLRRCEQDGVTIRHCPAYIRAWISGHRDEK